MNEEEQTVTIPKVEYKRLLERAAFLQRLENAGVDNWEWYDSAILPDQEGGD